MIQTYRPSHRLALLLYSAVSASALLTGCARSADTGVFSSDGLVTYAQPSVYKVLAFGDIEVTLPRSATTKKAAGASSLASRSGSAYASVAPMLSRSLLDNTYLRDRDAGVLESGLTQTDYCWQQVAEAPERYLEFASERETTRLEDVMYSHGSGFPISREGIVLTNAHVVAPPESCPPQALVTSVRQTLRDLSQEFGGPPPPALEEKVALSLLSWFSTQATVQGTFKEARVVVSSDKRAFNLMQLSRTMQAVLQRQANDTQSLRTLSRSAEVLMKGAVWPGKDVAVLKADVALPLCLSLGDSDDLPMGSRVHALGFPGAAVSSEMSEAAKYRVIAHEGEIDQKMPLQTGWTAFHMTCGIHQGDSGGPVVNEKGEVVAINVAINPKVAAQTYAVPINIAKEFLKEAHITPDLNKTTQHWRAGHRAFARREYTLAKKEFEQARPKFRSSVLDAFSEGDDTAKDPVEEMIARCDAAIRAGKDETSLWDRVCNGGAVQNAVIWGTEHRAFGVLILACFLLSVGRKARRSLS